MKPRDGRTPSQRKRAFLAAFVEHGTVMHAAAAIGIDRRSHQRWMHEDAAYAESFEQAKADVLDVYEREIHRRGVEGWEEPVYQGGKLVGQVRRYSDVLLIFRTKALAPERYRERHHVSAEVTHHDGDSKLDDEIAGLMAQFERLGEGPPAMGAEHPGGQSNGRAT